MAARLIAVAAARAAPAREGEARRPNHPGQELLRPRLRADLHLEIVEPDRLFLLSETQCVAMQSEAAVKVVPLLNGQRTIEEIAEAFARELPLSEVVSILSQLDQSGYLAEGCAGRDRAFAAFWDATHADPGEAAGRLSTARVSLTAAGNVPFELARRGLEESGIQLAENGDVVVAVVEDYLHPALASLNRRHLDTEKPWVLAKVHGLVIWIGPLFLPSITGCWECLAQRLQANRQVERYLQRVSHRDAFFPTSKAMLSSSVRTGCDLLSTELVRFLAAGHNDRLKGTLMTFNVTTLDLQRHVLIKQPQCPACGSPELAHPRGRPTLRSTPKRFTSDGGHRSCAPQETLDRLQKHVSPLLGAVSYVEPVQGPNDGIVTSYVAGHNFALIHDDLYFLRRNIRGQSGGKGRTEAQAKASAIGEAIERYVGVYRGDEPQVRASYLDSDPGYAVHPEELLLFSDRQYRQREQWNVQIRGGFHWVPNKLDPGRSIAWSEAWSLTEERPRLIPSAYCWFGHPDAFEDPFCGSDGNGNAAGNTVEEALVQALLELVERDSVALWWYSRARVPGFDMDSLNDPYVDALREYYAGLSRDIWMLDLTSDIGIPVFAACSRRLNHPVQDILLGFGAHLDVRMAAGRALTELNQSLPAVIDQRPDGSTAYFFNNDEAIDWWTSATLESEPYLQPDEGRLARNAQECVSFASEKDLAEDVHTCVDLLRTRGVEVIFLDQTRPDIELNVVKAMAPGLRHFWRRLGPGRLYDVPVELGWVKERLHETDLNPHSMFF